MKTIMNQRGGFALYVVVASILVVALIAGGVLGYASYAMRTTSRFLLLKSSLKRVQSKA